MDYYESWPLDLEAVIWDWDGTSADTLPHAFLFWKNICGKMGKPFPLKDYDHVRREMRDPFSLFYTEVLGIDFEKNDHWIKPAFKEYMDASDVRLRPGVRQTWDYCASLGLKTGIASSNLEEVINHRLDALEVSRGPAGLIRSVVGYGPNIRMKPFPDALIECASQLNVHPWACLYVGDTPGDILAPRAAGMRSAVISGGYSTIEKLTDGKPTFFVDSADELQVFIKRLIPIAQVRSAVWDP
ncbi:MAG: HAD family hydrolase [Nanoarchaeota archaeon]